MRSKIDNEVRPSTVKTWLTIWRHFLTQPTDHRLRVVAENRMRTPYATNILARINTVLYPTRPRREMQSYPRPRSLRSLFPLSRGPPEINLPTFTRQLLTGNSVEIVRHLRKLRFDHAINRATNQRLHCDSETEAYQTPLYCSRQSARQKSRPRKIRYEKHYCDRSEHNRDRQQRTLRKGYLQD
jgi:hypothetical protein